MGLGEIPVAGPDDIRPAHGAAATPDYGPLTVEKATYENALQELIGTGPIAAGSDDITTLKEEFYDRLTSNLTKASPFIKEAPLDTIPSEYVQKGIKDILDR